MWPLGMAVTVLWVPRLADIFGRRKVFIIGIICDAIFYTSMMLTHNYWVMMVTLFGFGLAASARMSVGFVYLCELCPSRLVPLIGSLFSVYDGSTYTFAVIYYWVISDNWLYYTLIGYALQIVGLVLVFSLPESPHYLIQLDKYQELEVQMKKTAKWNKQSLELDCEEIQNLLKETDEKFEESPPVSYFLA